MLEETDQIIKSAKEMGDREVEQNDCRGNPNCPDAQPQSQGDLQETKNLLESLFSSQDHDLAKELTTLAKLESLSDEDLKNLELEYQQANLPSTQKQLIVDKISAIKQKWQSVHDFDAQRQDPKLFNPEQIKKAQVINSGSMFNESGKRVASFIRVKDKGNQS